MDYFNTRGRKVMRKSRKQVNREERIRLAKHNRKLRAIAKRKSENNSEKSEEIAKVNSTSVDTI